MSPPSLLSRSKRYRGFGLLEVILVFAIIIGAGVIVFEISRQAQLKSQINDTVTLAQTLQSNLKLISKSLGPNAQANTTLAIQSHLVPAPMVKGNKIISPFGAQIVIYGGMQMANGQYTSTCGTTCSTLRLYIDAVPDEACVPLVMGLGASFPEVRVNGSSFGAFAKSASVPLTMASAISACQPNLLYIIASGG